MDFLKSSHIIILCIAEMKTLEHLVYEPLEVCAAFLSPNGICRNLNMPNVVVIAVFGTSSGSTGI